jgi:hypothetical protein
VLGGGGGWEKEKKIAQAKQKEKIRTPIIINKYIMP